MFKSNKLLKFGTIFFALLLIFTCTSCKAKEKTFSMLEMPIELTDEFHEKDHIGYTVYYEAKDMIVVCLKEEDFVKIDGLIKIGKCTKGCGVYLDNKKIEYKGYNHFE